MKKLVTLLTLTALVLPLATTAVTANAESFKVAENTQIRHATYTIVSRKAYKTAKTYHTGNMKDTVYTGLIAADQPTISITIKSHLKAYSTYKVTEQIKVKTNSTQYAYLNYVKGYGWVRDDAMTAGTLPATKATILASRFYKTSQTMYTKNTKPVVYKAVIAADQPTMTLTVKGNLQAKKTYKITQQVKVKNASREQTYVYVQGQGWVLKSGLIAG